MSVLFAFLHHLSAFALVAALAIELVLIRQKMTLANARKLQAVDAVLGAAAGLLLLVGLARVFLFEKGADYYFSSHAFLSKFGIFILLAVLSIIPTREFLSWRKATSEDRPPVVSEAKLRTMRRIIHIELGGVALILLFAAMMAKGGWV